MNESLTDTLTRIEADLRTGCVDGTYSTLVAAVVRAREQLRALAAQLRAAEDATTGERLRALAVVNPDAARRRLVAALGVSRGSRRAAAAALGCSREALYDLAARVGLDLSSIPHPHT